MKNLHNGTFVTSKVKIFQKITNGTTIFSPLLQLTTTWLRYLTILRNIATILSLLPVTKIPWKLIISSLYLLAQRLTYM